MIVASSPWRTSRGVIGPVLVAVAVSAAIIVGYVAIFSGDPSALVCLGRAKLGTPPFEAIRIAFPADGFDGHKGKATASSHPDARSSDPSQPPVRRWRVWACWGQLLGSTAYSTRQPDEAWTYGPTKTAGPSTPERGTAAACRCGRLASCGCGTRSWT